MARQQTVLTKLGHIYDTIWLYQRHICSSIFATFLEANNAVYACYPSQMAHNFVQSRQHNLQMRNKDIQGRLYALTADLWDAWVTVKQTILAKLGSPVRPVRLTKLVIVVKLVKLMTSIVFKGLDAGEIDDINSIQRADWKTKSYVGAVRTCGGA